MNTKKDSNEELFYKICHKLPIGAIELVFSSGKIIDVEDEEWTTDPELDNLFREGMEKELNKMLESTAATTWRLRDMKGDGSKNNRNYDSSTSRALFDLKVKSDHQ